MQRRVVCRPGVFAGSRASRLPPEVLSGCGFDGQSLPFEIFRIAANQGGTTAIQHQLARFRHSRARIAAPIALVPTAGPPAAMSAVRIPEAIAPSTAASICRASASMPNE